MKIYTVNSITANFSAPEKITCARNIHVRVARGTSRLGILFSQPTKKRFTSLLRNSTPINNNFQYHFACFQCSYCHQPILSGESFKIQNGHLICTKFNHEWNQSYIDHTKVSVATDTYTSIIECEISVKVYGMVEYNSYGQVSRLEEFQAQLSVKDFDQRKTKRVR